MRSSHATVWTARRDAEGCRGQSARPPRAALSLFRPTTAVLARVVLVAPIVSRSALSPLGRRSCIPEALESAKTTVVTQRGLDGWPRVRHR
jgi:hypothetical protein